MKTISIINLKGGVAKTISAITIAYILAVIYGKKVLLIDNDKQGNTSKMFNAHNYNEPSISELLTEVKPDINRIIKLTPYPNLHIIPANMTLLTANLEVMLDKKRVQQTRIKAALESVSGFYDYCIFDNAPDINMSTINALVASDDLVIPIKIDNFAFDGLKELMEQIDYIKQDYNPSLCFRGCFITNFKRNDVNFQGKEYLQGQKLYPIFNTYIRYTEKVDESTFAALPILEYSKYCGASKDYKALVEEYLSL